MSHTQSSLPALVTYPGHHGSQELYTLAIHSVCCCHLFGIQTPCPACPRPQGSVNCGRPEADFNSMVYGNDWWVGSVVRYGCRPGFLLVGDPASACQSDGHWTPKPTCLPGICLRGRIEINERDIDGSCSSTCTDKAHLGASLNQGCIKISNCVTKQWGWTRWFARCDFCECDCYVPCSSSG
ncbi:coagulation factor XIII B chain-like isoform 5-T6 [Macrochelys suwanniensis]